MTTNHKPTLESRRARDPYAGGGSSIAHGGAAHRQLKYRRTVRDSQNSEHEHRVKLEELKRELREREQPGASDNAQLEDVKTSSVPETYNERRQRVLEETKDLDASDSDSDTGDSDEESDSDSDDELLRELAKLKEEKLQKEKEQQQRAQERALAQQDSQQQQQQPVKKSWRQSVFKNNAGQGQDKNGEYVNDLLKSQFHQRFMDKHVR